MAKKRGSDFDGGAFTKSVSLVSLTTEKVAAAFHRLGLSGLQSSATIDQVIGQYRREVSKVHPDHGGSDEAFNELTQARKLCEAYIRRRVIKCEACNGNGQVAMGVDKGFYKAPRRICKPCKGTGRVGN